MIEQHYNHAFLGNSLLAINTHTLVLLFKSLKELFSFMCNLIIAIEVFLTDHGNSHPCAVLGVHTLRFIEAFESVIKAVGACTHGHVGK